MCLELLKINLKLRGKKDNKTYVERLELFKISLKHYYKNYYKGLTSV